MPGETTITNDLANAGITGWPALPAGTSAAQHSPFATPPNPITDKRDGPVEVSKLPCHRATDIVVEEKNEETYTVRLSVASSEPLIRQWWWTYIEQTQVENAPLDWLQSGNAPLLDGHDPSKQIGIVENPEVVMDSKSGYYKLYVDFRFFPEIPESKAAWDKVKADFTRNVSIGWSSTDDDIKVIQKDEDEGIEYETVIYRKPNIHEVSIVSVPADRTVGIGRQVDERCARLIRSMSNPEVKKMDDDKKPDEGRAGEKQPKASTDPKPDETRSDPQPQPQPAAEPAAFDPTGQRWLSDNEEHLRKSGVSADQIRGLRKLVDDAKEKGGIDEATVMKEAWKHISAAEEKANDVGKGAPPVIDNSREFKLDNVIKNLQRGREIAGFEGEIIKEFHLRNERHAPPRGGENTAFVPHAVFLRDPRVQGQVLSLLKARGRTDERYAAKAEMFTRAIEVGATPAGFFHEVFDESYLIEALVAQAEFLSKCTVLSQEQVQDLAVVKETGTATSFWSEENTQRSEPSVNPTYANFVFNWHQINCRIDTTQRALDQSRFFMGRIMEVLRRDVPRGINIALLASADVNRGVASIRGYTNFPIVFADGSATQPTNGIAPTYQGLTALRGRVEGNNARNKQRWCYVMSAETKQFLYGIGKFMGRDFPIIMMNANGMETIDGYEVVTDNNVPDNGTQGTNQNNLHIILFGDVGDIVIAPFSGVEIVVDPWTGLETSAIKVYARQALDAKLQQTNSLAAIDDAIV